MVLELPADHPHNEQTRKKIALLETRIRLAKSSLNSDIRDLSSNGYIRGLARRSRHFYDEWIAGQKRHLNQLEQMLKHLKGESRDDQNIGRGTD